MGTYIIMQSSVVAVTKKKLPLLALWIIKGTRTLRSPNAKIRRVFVCVCVFECVDAVGGLHAYIEQESLQCHTGVKKQRRRGWGCGGVFALRVLITHFSGGTQN